ncbi:MAG: IS3 family transposase [Kofleriaceae bacterium]
MRFAFILAKRACWPVVVMCAVLKVSASGFYAWLRSTPSARDKKDERLKVLIGESFARSRKTYGSPRVHADLASEHVGRNRVIRLMQDEKLVARVRRRYRSTTMSDHDQPVAANLLNREFEATAPNQRWVGDTTELLTPTGKFYLAAIVDLYARLVVDRRAAHAGRGSPPGGTRRPRLGGGSSSSRTPGARTAAVRPTSSAILTAQSPSRPGFIREQPAARHDIFEWFQPILFWHRTRSACCSRPSAVPARRRRRSRRFARRSCNSLGMYIRGRRRASARRPLRAGRAVRLRRG